MQNNSRENNQLSSDSTTYFSEEHSLHETNVSNIDSPIKLLLNTVITKVKLKIHIN